MLDFISKCLLCESSLKAHCWVCSIIVQSQKFPFLFWILRSHCMLLMPLCSTLSVCENQAKEWLVSYIAPMLACSMPMAESWFNQVLQIHNGRHKIVLAASGSGLPWPREAKWEATSSPWENPRKCARNNVWFCSISLHSSYRPISDHLCSSASATVTWAWCTHAIPLNSIFSLDKPPVFECK